MHVDYRSIRQALPEGRTLAEELWTRRHRGILVLLWAHAAVIPVFSVVRGFSLAHTLVEAAIVPTTAVLAATSALSRRQRSLAASLGLLSSSAVLVHLSGGVIEMHFHFFVMVAVVALYQDWVCFLAAIGYVLVHHGIIGALHPSAVFNHYAALNQPWRWAAIHAFFITGISVACLVTWRLDENLLDREREAEERLREETRIVETLNDVGRAVAAELDLRAVVQRVTDAATELTSAAFGAFFYDVRKGDDESYVLYTLSGAPADAFGGFPSPRNSPVFAPTFAGEGTLRLDDVTRDPRYGQNPPHHGLPDGHLPVRSYLAVPVRSARGPVLGGLFLGHPEPARFTAVDERLAEGIAAHAAVAIDNARLYEGQRQSREEAERAQRGLSVLAEASRALASSLDVERVLTDLAAVVVPAMADTCQVFLCGGDGIVRRAAAAPGDDDGRVGGPSGVRPIVAADPAGPIARSFGARETILLEHADSELTTTPAELGHHGGERPTSAIFAPLMGREGPVGVLALSTSAGSGRLLDRGDMTLAEELGRRAAVAIEHAHLYATQRSAAETLQHSLLPEVLPDLPGVEIASRYLPGGPDVEIGGDWYDVIALPDGRLALAMGDVVGRGVPAASLMGQLRNSLRAYTVEGRSPAQVLSLLNRLLHDIGSAHHMATLVVMVFDAETGELRYASAGHPPPIVKTGGGQTEFLAGAAGVPLGAMGHADYAEACAMVTPNSTLILYTDGLVEDRTMNLDVGLERLRTGVLSGPDDLNGLCEHLVASVPNARPGEDDVAILAVRWVALGSTLELQLPSQERVLRPLRATLRRWLAGSGLADDEVYEILVATSEACSNAIRHGAPEATHFGFRAELNGAVEIVVRSSGRWHERRSAAPGGRGLDIMRQFMDETQVDRQDGTTEVRMRRRLSAKSRRGATVLES